jgi:hypothetical protein
MIASLAFGPAHPGLLDHGSIQLREVPDFPKRLVPEWMYCLINTCTEQSHDNQIGPRHLPNTSC